MTVSGEVKSDKNGDGKLVDIIAIPTHR